MYTKDDVCKCLGLPSTISNKELKRKCKYLYIHCNNLAHAIDNNCKPKNFSVYDPKKWKSISRKEAKRQGLHWVLLDFEHLPPRASRKKKQQQ